jgi:eukaryotic-like serine/threonine-protein kinase
MAGDDKRERRERTRLAALAAKAELIGQVVLDRYVIEEVLGAGAMGTVYRGRHNKLKRNVAIKIMHEHLAAEPALLERFRREATAAGKLDHANVVSVLDVGEHAGKHVMVMEYAKGNALTDIMTGPLAIDRVLRLLVQLLRGLEHAHAERLVHRDLKPDNVILQTSETGEEVARIVDFGIAVLRAPDESIEGGRLTASGMIVGTPQYMAPEQARAEPVDQRADLYALGIIMYEMLSGITPFDGSPMEVALQKIDHDPPPFAQRAPHVAIDRVLEAYMRRLVARDREQRFATAHAALELLELYQRDRLAAASLLGVIDIERALAVVSLPDPPR